MKVRKKYFAIRLVLMLLFSSAFQVVTAHPFYVSICEIDFNQKLNRLEISLRIFTNDLEKNMEDLGFGKLYLGEKNESENADMILKNYISSILKLQVDRINLTPNYLGKETNQELTWIYLEVKDVEAFSEIEISNRLLYQSFATQTNLVHVKNKDETKSLLLTKNNSQGRLQW
ncbi:MAG: hypothetical protein JW729_07470 [Bacteroidales bacterium]|nr:hypothetical protein [Bacteroidales bacterium]